MSDNKRTRPVIQEDILVYQENGQAYQLNVGTSSWYAWLSTATTFTFRSKDGTFTACRERAGHKRGGWYWRAYRRCEGKLHRIYMGASEELTLERLRAAARALAVESTKNMLAGDEQKLPQHVLQGHLRSSACQERSPGPPTDTSRLLPKGEAALQHIGRSSSPLPLQLTPLIGRDQEVAAASALLSRPEVRLLTLTGTGGVGKTRLALHLASELRGNFLDGAHFVSLASTQDARLVLSTIVQALELQGGNHRSPLAHLQAALRERDLLLLLDNFEQVVAAAPLLLDLLTACSRLKILVTSREPLHVRGEYLFVVRPLAMPDPKHLPDNEAIMGYGAISLFLERAREVSPSSRMTPEDAPLIVEICQRLDGLPLAIELAVARLPVLPLPFLLERLEHRLSILTGGPRDAPVRQSTLRNTIAWSYGLLSEEEQRCFRMLAVFAGGVALEAVEHVFHMLGGKSELILSIIASLLDKHLLQQAGQDTSAPRFQMLETLREYGLEALTASGELEAVCLAHAQYYLALAEEAETHQFEKDQKQWFDPLEREHSNLRAVLDWSTEWGKDWQRKEIAWRLAGALQWFWASYGYAREGLPFGERALENGEGIAAPVQAKALYGAGWLALMQGEYGRAEALCQESLQLYRALHDPQGMALALYRLGLAASARSDIPQAIFHLEESVALFKEGGDQKRLMYPLVSLALILFTRPDHREYARARSLLDEGLECSQKTGFKEGIAWSLHGLGWLHFQQGDLTTARSLFEGSLMLYRALKQRRYISYPLYQLGRVIARQGDLPTAHAFFKESLALFQELDDQRISATCLEGWASVVARQGDAIWAAQLWGAAEVLCEINPPANPFVLFIVANEQADDEQMRAVARTQLGDQAFAQALAEGRAMTPEQALAARGRTELSSHFLATHIATGKVDYQQLFSLISPNNLTRREEEVLRLVAQGLSDAQVAQTLVVSPRTVNAHLCSIYRKLGVTSRHAATRYAIEHHLI